MRAEHDTTRKTLDGLIFVVAHCAFAVTCMWLGPATRGDIWSVFAWWGDLLSLAIPNISGWSSLTSFAPAAWVTLVILWTLLPLSVWWAARGDWVWGSPNRELFERRPSVLIWLVIFMFVLVAYIAFNVPELRDQSHSSRASRTVRSAIASRTSFGIYSGIAFTIVAMCLGVIPRTLRLWREATGRAS